MNLKPGPTPGLPELRASGALLMALALAGGSAASRAQDVYESFDAQGHVVYSDQSSAPITDASAPQDDAPSPPRVLHVCWTNCFTLVGEDGVYGRADGTDENWTVERFTADSLVLKRHDAPVEWNGYHAEVTYAGQVENDRLINVTVDGQAVGSIQIAWGRALDTLPGSNAERDRLAQNGSAATTAEAASDTGSEASVATSAAPLAASEAPPALPDEDQPPCDAVGSIWAPGYWVWVAPHYYWIAGVWMRPPQTGLMWTPGYWTFVNGSYVFRRGTWGLHVGYYGGINYGHGYFGSGYSGGHWTNGTFVYNTAVSRVNPRLIVDTYRELPTEIASSRVSYHGGLGGTTAPAPVEKHMDFATPRYTPSPSSRSYVAPKVAHVVQNRGEHTSRNTVRPIAVNAPSVPHRQSSSPGHTSVSSGATRSASHASRPVALHSHP